MQGITHGAAKQAVAPAAFASHCCLSCMRQLDPCPVPLPRLPKCSLAIPVLVLVASVAFLLRPPPQGSIDEGRLFKDPKTGGCAGAPGLGVDFAALVPSGL